MSSTMSAFTPMPHDFYQVETSSSEDSTSTVMSREWNNVTTIYVMLRYRYWQIKERRHTPLHTMQESIAQELANYFNVNKTPTQIRDKINNTRTSFHISMNTMRSTIVSSAAKKSTLPYFILKMMNQYFSNEKGVCIQELERTIQTLRRNQMSTFFALTNKYSPW